MQMRIKARFNKDGVLIEDPSKYVPQNPEPLARFLRELGEKQEQIMKEIA